MTTMQISFARGAILAHLDDAKRRRITGVTRRHPEVPHHVWSAALRSLLADGIIQRMKRWPWERRRVENLRRRRWKYQLTPMGAAAVASAMEWAEQEKRAHLIAVAGGRTFTTGGIIL